MSIKQSLIGFVIYSLVSVFNIALAQEDSPRASIPLLDVMLQAIDKGKNEKGDNHPVKELERLSSKGDANASFALARKYVKTNPSKNEQLTKLAAEQGHPTAQFFVALQHFPKFQEVEHWLLKSASSGDSRAQYLLGVLHEKGTLQSNGSIDAAKWYLLSANQGHSYAQNNLGALYLSAADGLLPKNQEQAFHWLKKSSEQNNPKGQYNLGKMYFRGVFVLKNTTEALRLLEQSAAQSYPKAQNYLSNIYFKGIEGVDINIEKALNLKIEAAKQGYVDAQLELAKRFATGEQIPKDPEKAANWFLAATRRISTQTQFEDARWIFLKTADFLLLEPNWNLVKKQILTNPEVAQILSEKAKQGDIFAEKIVHGPYNCWDNYNSQDKSSLDQVSQCITAFYQKNTNHPIKTQ
ncbi:MAG: tetratricopeptide repeat protein [Formosimonas sp.]